MSRDELMQLAYLQHNALAERVMALAPVRVSPDGRYTFRDFVMVLSAFAPKASYMVKLRYAFNAYDFDGDGKLGRDDLMQLIGIQVPSEQALTLARVAGEADMSELSRQNSTLSRSRTQRDILRRQRQEEDVQKTLEFAVERSAHLPCCSPVAPSHARDGRAAGASPRRTPTATGCSTSRSSSRLWHTRTSHPSSPSSSDAAGAGAAADGRGRGDDAARPAVPVPADRPTRRPSCDKQTRSDDGAPRRRDSRGSGKRATGWGADRPRPTGACKIKDAPSAQRSTY